MNVAQGSPPGIPDETLVALADNQRNAGQHVALGHKLSRMRRFVEAEACNRKAIELNPNHPMAHNNLGWTRQMQGDYVEAEANYERALELDPGLTFARRNLARLLVQLGRQGESLHLWHQEIQTGSAGIEWLQGLISTALRTRNLGFAGEYAAILAGLRWGSPWYPPRPDRSLPPLPVQPTPVFLTIPKLRHDIEQFLYLQSQGVLGDEFTAIIKDYQDVIDRLTPRGINVRAPLDSEAQRTIGHVYNRIVHVRHAPRLPRALSGKWDATTVEFQYLNRPPGVVVVDDFLSPEALESVRLFCLESTVWSGNRYAHGRLGAFLHDGFNCPLLLQVAEELREALPRVIGDRYSLRQLWGFKNGHSLPGDSTTHADFAAVNVNFWITPTEANLDETCGGLVVYGVDAPLNWDFATYNGRADIIKPFLHRQQARSITIPYRQNRAVIFNSDLFHGTSELRFRKGYENRRVNITMLYGDREHDVHHRHLARPDPMGDPTGGATSWRSAAFARTRRPQR